MAFLILDLRPTSRYCDGYYFQASAASAALAYHRSQWPDGRFRLFELRSESGRPEFETLLPLVDEERERLSARHNISEFRSDGTK